MKQILILLLAVLTCLNSFSQDEKFLKAMQPKVVAIDTTRNPATMFGLAAAFERIADAEKTQWLPYYYAALAQINAAYFSGEENMKAEKIDPIADKAEVLINKSDELNPNNSEIYVVKKMIASLRMIADPMNRFMTYGTMAEQAMQTAIKLNPDNPRIYLLQGQDKFYTPEQFGGSKTEAKKLFEEAMKKYAAFQPATPLDPAWGKGTAEYFLTQIK